jgi:hypothetical protein
MYISNAALGNHVSDELKMYQRIAKDPKGHPGRQAIRSLLDSFDVDGLEEPHRCLVHPPLGDNLSTFLRRNPVRRLPKPILAFVLYRLFLALDYLHRECQIIHTGSATFLLPIEVPETSIPMLTCNDISQTSNQTTSCFPSPTTWFFKSSNKTNFAIPLQGRKSMEEQYIHPANLAGLQSLVILCCVTLALPYSGTLSILKTFNPTSIARQKSF